MANLSEDIQCARSDTRPPMLDRTDVASWQQRIQLYCRGTEGALHLGPEEPQVYSDLTSEEKDKTFQMGTLRETLTEETKGALHLGPEQPRVYSDLTSKEKDGNQATIQDDKVVIQNVQGRQNRGHGNNARGAGAAGYRGAQNKVGYANPGQARQIKCYNCNGGQDNVLNVDNVFQADDCDSFDSDVDEAPTAQSMFMANLSSAYRVYDETGPSYDSNVLSEVHDHDHYQVAICEHHEVHEMHDDVQPNYVVDSYTGYTSDSNMISYD
nr:hypothetical protein [Tanacetum cinerariifolium]